MLERTSIPDALKELRKGGRRVDDGGDGFLPQKAKNSI